jgi:dolichyl-phosphate beta-glucosyltransferase
MKSLSLVIPVYCAEGLLKRILAHIPLLVASAEEAGFFLCEVIVVDDCSAVPVDLGRCCADSRNAVPVVLLRNDRNRGKGYSVRRGALAAKGDWVLMSDVDESAPLTEFSVLAPLCENAMVCGSRRGGEDARPVYRRFLSRLFNLLAGTGVDDSQCGFKLFNMSLMRPVFERQRICRFAFDVELILNAPSVATVHVKWQGRRRSSLKVWRDAPRMLWDLIRIRCGF